MQVQFEDHPTDPDKVILRKPRHPVIWIGLTDDEIEMIVENKRASHWEFVRQVEAILREKNARI